MSQSPFHPGERRVQARLGVRDIEPWARKVVRSYLTEEHRVFHTALPFLVAAARDARQRPWATLLTGPEGFVSSPDPQSLRIETRPVPGDALEGALVAGADLGLLGIELDTRRRNRVNGRLTTTGSDAMSFAVGQAFGNCPQYIHERGWRRVDHAPAGTPRRGLRLTADQRRWITAADTFFIASGHRGDGDSPTFGMDASHRGGDPGFVQVEGDGGLVFPDYAGNNYFNTLGNLVVDPRAGLLFVDFASGGLLQLTVRTTIDWDSPAVAQFAGARRLIRCVIDEIVELPSALPLRWEADADGARRLRLVERTPESEDVTSFVFVAEDGRKLDSFEAGQHLPIALEIPGHDEPVRRTYSLSSAPGRDRYRISVKREPRGLASCYLHDCIKVGAIVAARAPAGDFTLGCTGCPIVLISAGVGTTPMVSMLQALSAAEDERPVWFIHGARNGSHHALAADVRRAVLRRASIRMHIAYSQPGPGDRHGIDYDSEGRLDGALIKRLLSGFDAEYYLCGPVRFMTDMQTHLEILGVPARRIHVESFGPANSGVDRPDSASP